MLEDLAKRTTHDVRDQHRLAALWVAVNLLGSGNEGTLRRLSTAY